MPGQENDSKQSMSKGSPSRRRNGNNTSKALLLKKQFKDELDGTAGSIEGDQMNSMRGSPREIAGNGGGGPSDEGGMNPYAIKTTVPYNNKQKPKLNLNKR